MVKRLGDIGDKIAIGELPPEHAAPELKTVTKDVSGLLTDLTEKLNNSMFQNAQDKLVLNARLALIDVQHHLIQSMQG